MSPASPPDEKNRDRIDAEASRWAFAMLFTEPLKVIAAAHTGGVMVGVILTLLSVAQLLSYVYLAGRVGAHGGYTGLEELEPKRRAAIGAYVLYLLAFAGHFVVWRWLNAPIPAAAG